MSIKEKRELFRKLHYNCFSFLRLSLPYHITLSPEVPPAGHQLLLPVVVRRDGEGGHCILPNHSQLVVRTQYNVVLVICRIVWVKCRNVVRIRKFHWQSEYRISAVIS